LKDDGVFLKQFEDAKEDAIALIYPLDILCERFLHNFLTTMAVFECQFHVDFKAKNNFMH